MYRGLRVGPEGVYLGPKGRPQGGPKCIPIGPCLWYVPSACGPTVAAHSAVCWLARTVGHHPSSGADRLVTMAEGNTILYGSQDRDQYSLGGDYVL